MKIISLFKPPQVYAQEQWTNPVVGLFGQPDGAGSGELFTSLAVNLWRVAINMGALLVILFYVIAAFEWLTSGGDSGKLEKARNRFIHTTIGLILLVASFAIIGLMGDLLFGDNFNLLELSFPMLSGSDGSNNGGSPSGPFEFPNEPIIR